MQPSTTTKAVSVARNKSAETEPVVARNKTSLPKAQGTKPTRIKGYAWRANGTGWECRRLWTDATGKRKQTYVAHLSQEAFGKLKRQHRGPAQLAQALTAWISEREQEKGIG